MNSRNLFQIFGVLVVVMLLSTFTFAQKNPTTPPKAKDPNQVIQETVHKTAANLDDLLIGFNKTDAIVYFKKSAIRNLGITEQAIEDSVKAKLKQGGFTIDELTTPGFDVNLDMIRVSDTEVAYYVELSLIQYMILERNKAVVISVPTWKKSRFGKIKDAEIQKIISIVCELVDEFLAEYRKANSHK